LVGAFCRAISLTAFVCALIAYIRGSNVLLDKRVHSLYSSSNSIAAKAQEQPHGENFMKNNSDQLDRRNILKRGAAAVAALGLSPAIPLTFLPANTYASSITGKGDGMNE